MRRFLFVLPALAAAACLDTTSPTREPIDCETLATSVTASEPSLTTTASGLKYRDVTVGTGPVVDNTTVIAFHYSGCLVPSGTKFDERTNVDPTPQLDLANSNAIAGFNEGVIGMRVGGRRQLVIPPELAWGSQGAVDTRGNVVVPPNTTVVFTVDIVTVR